jgi:type 1 fimbria pilin
MEIKLKILLSVFLIILSSGTVFAADSYCLADGGTHNSILNFSGKTISTTQNHAGQMVNQHVDNGDVYQGFCYCNNDFDNVYYTAKGNPGLSTTANRNNIQYYDLNENLDVGISISIYKSGYINVPFTNQANGSTGYYSCVNNKNIGAYSSGSDAIIYFYIKEPFIGKVTIPRTLVASLYGKTSRLGQDSVEPLSNVYIQGDITAPQECEINGGQVIIFDFGQIPASEFSSTAGAAIANRKQSVSVSVKCTGMAEGQDVDISLNAMQSGSYPTMLQTDHADVGIKVYDESGNEVDVNGGNMANEMGPRTVLGDQNGTFTFSAAPASATGKRPAPKTFDATATLTIELQN